MPQRLVVLAAWPHPREEASFGALLAAGLDCSVDFLPGKVDRSALAGVDLAFVLLHGSCDRTCDPVALIQGITDICPVLAVGEERDTCAITKLIEGGIADFIIQPCPGQEVVMRARRAMGMIHPRSRPPDSSLAGTLAAHRLIGTSPAFAREVAKLGLIAPCDAGVLILGETGTGKEVFAQAVHYGSARADKPLVAVNCGAIPHELIEAELFGHCKGAYTTAHASRAGLVREAEGGSLFLDDVDCLPLSAQAKLLRFLQEHEYRAVGSSTVMRADARVIAASNRELAALAARGQFRQDLFYRLNVLSLTLPPLRERRGDIGALAQHFVRYFAMQFQRPVRALTPRAMRSLLTHTWPGNVRELQHVLERAVLLAPGPDIDASDIDVLQPLAEAGTEESFKSLKARAVQNFECGYIENLLSSTNGNVTHAARAAGKNRRAFFELIRKHHITPARYRTPAG